MLTKWNVIIFCCPLKYVFQDISEAYHSVYREWYLHNTSKLLPLWDLQRRTGIQEN